MARPIGAKNKSKYIGVKLADLNEVFGPNAIISIAAFYDGIVNNVEAIKLDQPPKRVRITKIE